MDAKDFPIYWVPGPWVRGLSQLLVGVGVFFAIAPVMRLLVPLTRGMEYRVVASLAILAGLLVVALVLHELGHYLAARWQGASVLRVQLGPVQLVPQRGRWLARWMNGVNWLAGGVMAFLRIDAPFRRQMAWFIAAGSLANLLAAAVACLLAWRLVEGDAGRLLYAFALVNLVLGVANLLPTSAATDGTQLIRLIKGLDLGQPGMEATELNMRAMAGQAAEDFPAHLLEGLEREWPAMALWFQLYAAMRRDDWEGIQSVCARLDAWENLLDRVSRNASVAFLSILRAEIAFARGLYEGVAPPAPDQAQLPEFRISRPGMVERHEALAHALAGRWTECQVSLDRAIRESECSIDPSARNTEALLRDRIGRIQAMA